MNVCCAASWRVNGCFGNKKYKVMENNDWKNDINGTVDVRVTPRAASERIIAEPLAQGGWVLRVYVTCVPEGGKANASVIAALAKALKLPKSAITIVRGHTGRNKVIEIRR